MIFIANPGTGKVHCSDCGYAAASFEVQAYEWLCDALADGFEEAGCCLSDRPVRVAQTSRVIIKRARSSDSACCVCGHSRRVERAHIVPKHAGGCRTAPLCPNCHQAFDFGQMDGRELAALAKWCRANLSMSAHEVANAHGWGRASA